MTLKITLTILTIMLRLIYYQPITTRTILNNGPLKDLIMIRTKV